MLYNYKYKIQAIMNWSNYDFEMFFMAYEAVITFQSPKTASRQIYTSKYLDTVLTLFFHVYSHKINNKKAFLLALILNGVCDDRYNLYPNNIQTEFNKTFFKDPLGYLVDKNTLETFQFLCDKQDFEDDCIDKLYFDYLLFHDFRLVFKALHISNDEDTNLFVFYHFNPSEIMHSKNLTIDSPLILEALENIYNQILNLNMKDLYRQKIEAYKDFALT